ncbi:heat shock 70 kDa protein 4-like [Vicia villosa]|uniref:heat shock 70 kDa protein 4-like n=1 Tax=Vicia villosa TaxID=3911 RepID=UPI00273BCAA2|nr:heat shock 70 kDa protein 4-like [Vicia villosa]
MIVGVLGGNAGGEGIGADRDEPGVDGIEITWDIFKREFLRRYFPEDVRGRKEVEFLELVQGNMTVPEYAAKFVELEKYYVHYKNDEAKEKTSGNKQDITITNINGRLLVEEIERMIREAKNFKAEDMKYMKKARAMSDLDHYLYEMKKVMKDTSVSSKLIVEYKVKIVSAITMGNELIDDNEHQETFVFVDFLREIKSIFELAMKNINKG